MTEETPVPGTGEQPATSAADPATPATQTWESNGTSGPGGAIADPTSAGDEADATHDQPQAPDDGSAFLANLASAMKEAATAERTRVAGDVDRRRETHLASIETRRESEASRMRQLADDDRAAIQAWVESEQQRINEERDRRTAALEADLEASLAEHGAKVDAEKARVEAAIAAHRTDLDAYFSRLEGETDPVAIAQQAGRRPAFPDLDAIGKEAPTPTAAPAGQDRMIGVMASSRPTTKLSQAWAAWNASNAAASAQTPDAEAAPAAEPHSAAAPVDPQVNPVDPSPAREPVAVAAGSQATDTGSSEAPSESQPPSQSPFGGMSWLRRDKGNDQKG